MNHDNDLLPTFFIVIASFYDGETSEIKVHRELATIEQRATDNIRPDKYTRYEQIAQEYPRAQGIIISCYEITSREFERLHDEWYKNEKQRHNESRTAIKSRPDKI